MIKILDENNEFRKKSTENVIEIIDFVKSNKPSEATHMKVYRKRNVGINGFGIGYEYYETYVLYYNDVPIYHESKYFEPMLLGYEKVKDIRICGDTRWEEVDSINYILYEEGLYRPYSEKDLNSIKNRYHTEVNYKIIYPIDELYSDEYRMRMICKDIIENHKDSRIDLNFILDYDYYRNRDEKHLKGKKDYAIKGEIICDDIKFITDFDWFTKIWILFDKMYSTLKYYGVENVFVNFNMTNEDRDRFIRFHNWGGLMFD